MHDFSLLPFETDCPVDVSGTAHLNQETSRGILDLSFCLSPLENIRLPIVRSFKVFMNRLWEETCCEIFLKDPERREYIEINLSPSLNWAVFYFSSYRKLKKNSFFKHSLKIETSGLGETFKLSSQIPLSLFEISHWKNLEVYPSCVLELENRKKHYFALSHPYPSKADFHKFSEASISWNFTNSPMSS